MRSTTWGPQRDAPPRKRGKVSVTDTKGDATRIVLTACFCCCLSSEARASSSAPLLAISEFPRMQSRTLLSIFCARRTERWTLRLVIPVLAAVYRPQRKQTTNCRWFYRVPERRVPIPAAPRDAGLDRSIRCK